MTLIQQMIKENVQENFDTNAHFYKMKQGDTQAREQIIVQWMGLVLHVAKSFPQMPNCTTEDYFSAGVTALINAVDGFDVTKEIKFSTYATTSIKRAMIRLQKNNIKQNFISLDSNAYNNDENDNTLIDVIPDDYTNDKFNQLQSKLDFERIRPQIEQILNPSERKIVTLFYGLEDGVCYKREEIANAVGIKRTCVDTILYRAMRKLKANLANENAPKTEKSLIKRAITKPTKNEKAREYLLTIIYELDSILTKEEFKYITLRYGLEDGNIRTQAVAGAMLKLTAYQVAQLEISALTKIKAYKLENEKGVAV